ncbi:MAG: response regulator [Epulopiscium sp.]|nr:response regulator [Candidatus Epulonipiscium sp.]
MYKLIIVDDEPLIQVGIKSMINWQKLNIKICGTAHNGKQALDLMDKNLPDIVITDIKMPIMDGLELMSQCKKRYDYPPVFIILTSYDEFPLIQQALRLNAIDYIIKMELNEQTLQNCIKNAMKKIKREIEPKKLSSYISEDLFTNQFLLRLLNMHYTPANSIKNYLHQTPAILKGKFFSVTFFKINFSYNNITNDERIQLYNYIIQMVEEIISRQFQIKTVPIDKDSFVVILALNQEDIYIIKTITTTHQMIYKYFNIQIFIGIGNVYKDLTQISNSYYEAMQALRLTSKNQPVIYYNEIEKKLLYKNTFNTFVFHQALTQALDELNIEKIECILNEILDLLNNYTTRYLQAFDVCSNILYILLTMLDSAEEMLENIFIDEKDSYQSIYRQNNIPALTTWLEKLKNGLVLELNKKKNEHSNYLVTAVQKYIHNHYTEKLSLQEIATKFNVSPNYLSFLFKKYSNINFSNYVSSVKIQHAKTMLVHNKMNIQDISEYLGFNNPYYFSKVFKKFTGHTPKEYQINSIIKK